MSDAHIHIIDASESHLPGIRDIYNQAVRETFSIWSTDETTTEQRKTWMIDRRYNGYPVIVAVAPDNPGDVLGYASMGQFRNFPGYVATAEHSVYVAPSAHRRGIGTSLLSRLIVEAEQSGLKTLVGGVDAQNTASIALHERLGFEQQACLKGVGQKFGKMLDLVFMVKALNPPS